MKNLLNTMVLLFPQYQAGYVPSHIPNGTPDLRQLWQKHEGFFEVPLQATDDSKPETDRGIRFRRILRAQKNAAAALLEKAAPEFVLTTGGDCGASFSSIAYLNKKYDGKIGVIWVDAHADIHAPSTSPSGNYHGMIARHLLGHPEFDQQPELALKDYQLAYLGLRDTEKEEDDFTALHHIPAFRASEIMDDNAPMDVVIDHFKRHGLTHLHLHVDCDVMDEKVFPYVHVPEPNGLGLSRLIEILQYLRSKMPLAGCCLTEYAPQKAGEGMDVMKRLYQEGLGLEFPDA